MKLRYCSSHIYQPSYVTVIPLLFKQKITEWQFAYIEMPLKITSSKTYYYAVGVCVYEVCYLWKVFTVSVSSFCNINGNNHHLICTVINSVFNANDRYMHTLDLTILNWPFYILMLFFYLLLVMTKVIQGLLKASPYGLS